MRASFLAPLAASCLFVLACGDPPDPDLEVDAGAGLMWQGAPLRIDGAIDVRAGDDAIAATSYELVATVEADVLIRIATVDDLDGFEDLTLATVRDGAAAESTMVRHHGGVYVSHLRVGRNAIQLDGQVTTVPVGTHRSYTIDIAPLVPDLCPGLTSAADYVESHDGPGHDGNDVAAEPTGIVLDRRHRRILGLSGDVPVRDGLKDRDAFAVRTSIRTTELVIRGDWASGDARRTINLMTPDLRQVDRGVEGGNLAVFQVDRDRDYWLWITTPASEVALPDGYALTICASSPLWETP